MGAASVARSSSKRSALFAATPLLFAAQQASEGVVWFTMNDAAHATMHHVAVFAFLGFALVVWPLWVPLSVQLIERSETRRRILWLLFAIGVVAAAGAVVLLTRSRPIAVVTGHSIRYDRAGDTKGIVELLILLLYILPAIVPLFVSAAYLTRTIGVLLVIALVATALIERTALASVWCFFAAMLSGLVWVAVARADKYESEPAGAFGEILAKP
jgi:hypothetical protein